jgi:hypothetical protein
VDIPASTFWEPKPIWAGKTVFIIGGGPSLVGMDWGLIHGRPIIGCNDAYLLGPQIVDVCYFGDKAWFNLHQSALASFPNIKVTCNPELACHPVKGIRVLARQPRGIHDAPRIGWFYNTGASAINLAIILGARRVALLGFDMKPGKNGESNWHPNTLSRANDEVYAKFVRGFGYLKEDLARSGKQVVIVNCTPDSALTTFPYVPLHRILEQALYQEIYELPDCNYGRADKNRCPGARFFPLYRHWIKGPVFDFGSGTGDTVKLLRKFGYVADGMDQIQWPTGMRCGDICQPLPEGIPYKTALCIDVVEHVSDADLKGLYQNLARAERQIVAIHCGPALQKGVTGADNRPIDLHINIKSVNGWLEAFDPYFEPVEVLVVGPKRYIVLGKRKP